MYNKYGFYESIDYTPTRLRKKRNKSNSKNIYGTPPRINIIIN